MSLQTYNKKRRFKKTTEPRGKRSGHISGAPLHFVVQKHDAQRLHYDLRLELDGVLKSWAVPKGPSLNPDDKRLAIMTEDHPLSYADFEGSIPKGEYGAGDVIVWDSGVYTSDKTGDPDLSRKYMRSGLSKGECSFVLLGEKLKGKFTLIRMKGRGENAWLLIKAHDEYVTQRDITKESQSVISGETLPRDVTTRSARKTKSTSLKKAQLAKTSTRQADPMPHRISPMLARSAEKPFDREGWFFEVKWDGYRAISEIAHGTVRMYSRNGISFNKKYAVIADALKELKHTCVLDGEIIALKDGRPDFHALQQYEETAAPLRYILFDLLYLGTEDLRHHPLRERKRLLSKLFPKHELLVLSEHIERDGKAFFRTVMQNDFEGMLAKDSSSAYREGIRSGSWLKIKSLQVQEAIIIGYTKPRGSRKLFGALVLAAYEGDTLRYIGHSGGGFSDSELKELHQKLSRIKVKKSPLFEKVPINSPITWVRPQYVCQVKFFEWTDSGRMRHPIYAGLRIDKEPREVVRELSPRQAKSVSAKEGVQEPVTVTNTDKVFWPKEGYTKGDVIEYYERMAETLLPYLIDRPQNLNRHPNGIEGKHFFQKNFTTKLPSYVETKEIWSESNAKHIRYIICNNKETLLYLANLGCIELNPWNSRTVNLEKPDYMILDLDPNGRPFNDLVRVAKEVRKVLKSACIEHYIKTSGKTGLHIIVPCGGYYSYDDIRTFAELIMHYVHQRVPDITSLERNPKKRKGKIYLDYLQNRFGQTLACAYSLRPYPGATVSTPLEWHEVRSTLDPAKFTIKTIWKRLEKKGDLWNKTQGKSIDLSEAIRCLEVAGF